LRAKFLSNSRNFNVVRPAIHRPTLLESSEPSGRPLVGVLPLFVKQMTITRNLASGPNPLRARETLPPSVFQSRLTNSNIHSKLSKQASPSFVESSNPPKSRARPDTSNNIDQQGSGFFVLGARVTTAGHTFSSISCRRLNLVLQPRRRLTFFWLRYAVDSSPSTFAELLPACTRASMRYVRKLLARSAPETSSRLRWAPHPTAV